MSKVQKVKGIRLELEIPEPPYCIQVKENLHTQYYEREAKELEEFIRDHRSCDQYRVTVVKNTQTECEFCESEWYDNLDNDGCPLCCAKAVEEWEKTITRK